MEHLQIFTAVSIRTRKRRELSPTKDFLSPPLAAKNLKGVEATIILDEMKQIKERLRESIRFMLDTTNISTKLQAVEETLTAKIESEIKLLKERAGELNEELQKQKIVEQQTKTTTNSNYSSNAVLFGLPLSTNNNNLKSKFLQICTFIGHASAEIRDICRTRTAFILKFFSACDRICTLRGFAEYRKQSKSK